MEEAQKPRTSMYSNFRGGPIGYGDPECRVMGDTERGTIFSKFVQERMFTDLCLREWSSWRRCLRRHNQSWIPSFYCRDLYNKVEECQVSFLNTPEKLKKIEDEYLDKRSEYRRTGVGHLYMEKQMVKRFSTPEADEAVRQRFEDPE
ncbi:hypothetical protein Ciccas_003718 [Cichlidogyrus casuarinus]|uniref:COX assembly mitochondrial protein n=1 Tax=Cichlidogyrus casuarinus TaxID=1844966 RepID=A0ABD2QDK2_9PLAT